jgi:hypothetical protein
MGNLEYRMQLKSRLDGTTVIGSGGNVFVTKAGSPDKATLFDKTGASQANPFAPTRGFVNFFVADTVASVDLYVQAPGGQFTIMKGVVASGLNEIMIDLDRKEFLYEIPFSIADTAAATETATGFVVPDPAMVLDRLHGAGLNVTAIHAAKTVDVGTAEASAAGGDADTFIAASSVGTLGLVVGTNGDAYSTNAPYISTSQGNANIVYTLSSATTTAKGFALLPVRLCN